MNAWIVIGVRGNQKTPTFDLRELVGSKIRRITDQNELTIIARISRLNIPETEDDGGVCGEHDDVRCMQVRKSATTTPARGDGVQKSPSTTTTGSPNQCNQRHAIHAQEYILVIVI